MREKNTMWETLRPVWKWVYLGVLAAALALTLGSYELGLWCATQRTGPYTFSVDHAAAEKRADAFRAAGAALTLASGGGLVAELSLRGAEDREKKQTGGD